MAEITSIFQSSIEADYVLKKENAFWVVEETNPNTKNPKLLVNGSGIFGFSLDCTTVSKPAWKFIKTNAVSGLNSVCDGIFVTCIDSCDYFVAIDLKSTNSNGAPKQLVTSIRLCQWLYSVLNLHGHLDKPAKFIGVISKISQRAQTVKRTSVRKPIPDPVLYEEIPIIKLENFQKVSLTDICNKC
ncbi:hypothetical protein [Pantoea agglomerans]|uniref:hypothetical protein n=1 Tax=Enterobacter agglomerans TaxID=549 RepID=UPI00320A844A